MLMADRPIRKGAALPSGPQDRGRSLPVLPLRDGWSLGAARPIRGRTALGIFAGPGATSCAPLTSPSWSPIPAARFSAPRSLSREAHLSALPPRARASSRLAFADGHQEWPEGHRPPSGQGPQAPHGL